MLFVNYDFYKVDFFLSFKAKFSTNLIKLDGVAPLITDPSPTSFTTLSRKKKYIKKKLHVTCDT